MPAASEVFGDNRAARTRTEWKLCFSFACPNCPIYGGSGWNWDTEMLKQRSAILPCAAARWFFFLLLNLSDCQASTAEKSDLLTAGYFGDVVCKAMQSACLPQFQIISNMVLVKIPNAVLTYLLEFPLHTACFYNSSGPLTECYGMSMECVIAWI